MTEITVPSLEEIDRLSRDLGCPFPDSYRQFVQSPRPDTLHALKKICPNGWFVRSKEELGELAEFLEDLVAPIFINGSKTLIDEVKASDFETPSGLQAYGFDLEVDAETGEEPRVTVFCIHAIVAQWTNFTEWVEWMEWMAWRDEWRKSNGSPA